jgi:hypothetical protein
MEHTWTWETETKNNGSVPLRGWRKTGRDKELAPRLLAPQGETPFIELGRQCQWNFAVMSDRSGLSIAEIRAQYNAKTQEDMLCAQDPAYSAERDVAKRAWLQASFPGSREASAAEDECIQQIMQLISSGLVEKREELLHLYAGDLFAFMEGISQATLATSDRGKHQASHPPVQKQRPSATRSFSSRQYTGAMLRSARIRPLRPGLAKNVEKLCLDMGLPIKPCVPIEDICAKYEDLRRALSNLLDSRRATERLEQELKALKGGSTRPPPIHSDAQSTEAPSDDPQDDVNPWVLEDDAL